MEINVDGRDPRSSDRAGRRRTVDGSTRPDSELLDWVREEDSERREAAVAELYRRHRGAASAVAARLVPAGADVDDVVEDAFERVNRAIRNGRGPTEDFRSYLVVAVRSGASDLRRGRSGPCRARRSRRSTLTTRPPRCWRTSSAAASVPRSPPCPSAGGRSCGWSTSSNARPARWP